MIFSYLLFVSVLNDSFYNQLFETRLIINYTKWKGIPYRYGERYHRLNARLLTRLVRDGLDVDSIQNCSFQVLREVRILNLVTVNDRLVGDYSLATDPIIT